MPHAKYKSPGEYYEFNRKFSVYLHFTLWRKHELRNQ